MKILDSGLIYRNPVPHLRSVQAYFPSIDKISDKEFIGTIVLGEAFESLNLHSYFVYSNDGGRHWELGRRVCGDVKGKVMSDACRLKVLDNKEILIFLVKHDRTNYRDKGLTNEETLGFVPTLLYTMHSKDKGKLWGKPVKIKPPLIGPCFELCSPPVQINNGDVLIPTSTWCGWDGYCPGGMRAIALISHDNGKTWTEYSDVMKDAAGRIIFWESKIIQLYNGKLVAVAWAYDKCRQKDLPNHYAISYDYGKTWGRSLSTHIHGQTPAILPIYQDEILLVYRRIDKSGLWANMCNIKDGKWINKEEFPLWGYNMHGLVRKSKNMAINFQGLRFGAPCLLKINDDTVMVAFWCYEDFVSNIRWIRIKI